MFYWSKGDGICDNVNEKLPEQVSMEILHRVKQGIFFFSRTAEVGYEGKSPHTREEKGIQGS